MKTPTFKKIILARMLICKNAQDDCVGCPINEYKTKNGINAVDCVSSFVYAVLTGAMTIDGKPVVVSKTETTTPTCSETEQVPAKPAFPKWCEVGRWVLDSDGHLWVIKEIKEGIVDVEPYPGASCYMSSIPRQGDYRPVRFRPYTFEEAKTIAGKKIHTTYCDSGHTFTASETVYCVISETGGTVTINGKTFREWQCLNATIDGVPFGVPEVDTEEEGAQK